MLLVVDPQATIPLADQIANQVRGAIARGELAPRERLTSARELAAALDVNMHTVLRAYGRLRDEGLLELRRGRGASVAATARADHVQLQTLARELVERARLMGMDVPGVLALIKEVSSP